MKTRMAKLAMGGVAFAVSAALLGAVTAEYVAGSNSDSVRSVFSIASQ